MEFSADQIEPVEMYRLMVGGIVPRPIAWISTQSESGVTNLAPYSFFTAVSCQPPVLAVTVVLPRDGRMKDTMRNLQSQGECVVNVVSAGQVEIMNQSCGDYPVDISEFETIGIETVDSVHVTPPGVAGAPVRYECRLRDTLVISDQPMGGQVMLLDVIAVIAEDRVVVDGRIDSTKLGAVGKLGGDGYSTTDETFNLARPVIKR